MEYGRKPFIWQQYGKRLGCDILNIGVQAELGENKYYSIMSFLRSAG